MATIHRNYSVGPEVLPTGGVHFRVWAPDATQVHLILGKPDHLEDRPSTVEMEEEGAGYWSVRVASAQAGMWYFYDVGKPDLYPDPASRFQPGGPHGASQIVDASSYVWRDTQWRGISARNRVIYEMHIGTFIAEGTYIAAARELTELAQLGITVIQMMPVVEFAGKFGWGYDGVDLYAPYHHYGTPDELRYFIDCAHDPGIGVILDVVYNHCGSVGCYLQEFSQHYFSSRYKSEWGATFNFDGDQSAPVREFIIENAVYWIREFHFDGFRLDATQQIFDSSRDHIVAELVWEARKAAGDRTLYIIAENEPQQCHYLYSREHQGFGLDGLLNDDFHHAATAALKGFREAYFYDYRGSPQEFVSALKYGFLYQGQWYAWQKQPRGTPSFGISIDRFIHFLQNHDQVANTGFGKRLHTAAHPGLYRAFTALLLLGPATPLLFQGQEFCADSPFLYFADHQGEFADQVFKGRNEFLQQFSSLADSNSTAYLTRPDDVAVFQKSKLDFSQRIEHAEAYNLHRDLLRLRREDPVFSGAELAGVDGSVLSDKIFMLRFFSRDASQDRLLLINLQGDFPLSPIPEPLLAPHPETRWQLLWCSEHPRYGGRGMVQPQTDENWILPGFAAVVLQPHPFMMSNIRGDN